MGRTYELTFDHVVVTVPCYSTNPAELAADAPEGRKVGSVDPSEGGLLQSFANNWSFERFLLGLLAQEVAGGVGCRLPYCSDVIEPSLEAVARHYFAKHPGETVATTAALVLSPFIVAKNRDR